MLLLGMMLWFSQCTYLFSPPCSLSQINRTCVNLSWRAVCNGQCFYLRRMMDIYKLLLSLSFLFLLLTIVILSEEVTSLDQSAKVDFHSVDDSLLLLKECGLFPFIAISSRVKGSYERLYQLGKQQKKPLIMVKTTVQGFHCKLRQNKFCWFARLNNIFENMPICFLSSSDRWKDGYFSHVCCVNMKLQRGGCLLNIKTGNWKKQLTRQHLYSFLIYMLCLVYSVEKK